MSYDVLVPHDLTEGCDATLEAVAALGTPMQALHVLHVLPRVDPSVLGAIWPIEQDDLRVSRVRKTITTRLRRLRFGHAVVHVKVGDPATRIVALAQELDAKLIALPSHSRSGLQRFLLGSVAENVARFAHCPVLILPAGAMRVGEAPPSPATASRAPTAIEQVDGLGSEIVDRIAQNAGFLSAARIAVPFHPEPGWWEEQLVLRLGRAGVAFVDLVFTPGPESQASILELRFEDAFT